MDNEKFDSRVLEPDLIFSKDGEVLERSDCENDRFCNEILFSSLSRLLLNFLASRRF